MSSSLKDQLLGLGFKPAPKPERKPDGRPPGDQRRDKATRPSTEPAGVRKPHPEWKARSQQEIDLGKAYAIRAQKEKEERIEAEWVRQEEARVRREARAKLVEFLEGKALNAADGEIARHFSYGGKIKRIRVTAEQLRLLNAGQLGVVQDKGRYLLVTAAVLAEAETIFPDSVALKVDPNAPAVDDPYGDPQYQVPDDLVW